MGLAQEEAIDRLETTDRSVKAIAEGATMENEKPCGDEAKATAILAGYLREGVVSRSESSKLQDAALEFSRLLAMITAPKKTTRDVARKRVRALATFGGWVIHSTSKRVKTLSPDNSVPPAITQRKGVGTWSAKEKALILQEWQALDFSRDGQGVLHLCKLTGRSPLAIVIRLFRDRVITLDEGDALCRASGAAIPLSKAKL